MPTMTSTLVTPDEAVHTLRVHPTTVRANGYRINDQGQRVEGREYLALKIDLAGGDEPVSPSRILTQKEAPDGTQLTQVRDPTTGEAQTLTLIRPVVCSECVEAMAREFGMRSIPEADVAVDQAIDRAERAEQVVAERDQTIAQLEEGARVAGALSRPLEAERKPSTKRSTSR
jgi:hypothetical protein